MRSPSRPLWSSGQPLTRAVVVVISVLTAATLACVYVPPLARMLHLQAFPAQWWLVVVVAASTTAWTEPFKRMRRD